MSAVPRGYNPEEIAAPGEFYSAPTSRGQWNIWQRPHHRDSFQGNRISIATTSAGPYANNGYDPENNARVARMLVRALNDLRKSGWSETPADEKENEAVMRALRGEWSG